MVFQFKFITMRGTLSTLHRNTHTHIINQSTSYDLTHESSLIGKTNQFIYLGVRRYEFFNKQFKCKNETRCIPIKGL